jgi:hypothetical protein
MSLEPGVIIDIDGIRYPLTVEEAWTLRAHVDPSDELLGGPAEAVRVLLKELVERADGLVPEAPAARIFETEKGVLAHALNMWLHAVKAPNFPPRAMALRDGFFIHHLGSLAVRNVLLRFKDDHEERVRGVVVEGDPFQHDGRTWKPQHWHAEREDDDELVVWLVCREW